MTAIKVYLYELKNITKTYLKKTLVSDDWFLYNYTDKVVVAYPENIPEDVDLTNYKDFASMMLVYPGEKSQFTIDSAANPANADIENPEEWDYIGVRDGNSLILSGNQNDGYKAKSKTTTDKTIYSDGNIISRMLPIKGPYHGFDEMSKGMKGQFEEGNGTNIQGILYNEANRQCIEANKSLQNNKETSLSNRTIITSKIRDTSNNNIPIAFKNVTFDNSGIAYFGFNEIVKGCTK